VSETDAVLLVVIELVSRSSLGTNAVLGESGGGDEGAVAVAVAVAASVEEVEDGELTDARAVSTAPIELAKRASDTSTGSVALTGKGGGLSLIALRASIARRRVGVTCSTNGRSANSVVLQRAAYIQGEIVAMKACGEGVRMASQSTCWVGCWGDSICTVHGQERSVDA